MSENATTGCSCELCRPNYYMGWNGGFVPEPERERELQRQEQTKKPVVKPEPMIPALAVN